MTSAPSLSRRSLLGVAVAAVAAPAVLSGARPAAAAPLRGAAFGLGRTSTPPGFSFAAQYQTNVAANTTLDSNAAVRILSGMQALWKTGDAWNTGTVLSPAVLRASMQHSVDVTTHRTAEQAARAFINDRRDQSYSAAEGLGPLAPIYRAGALSVTSITSAPVDTPPAQINDAVPAGAAPGSAIGAGSPTSELGAVVALMSTLRGNYSSGNPSKAAYQYPRPWRMNLDNQVVDTGRVDALGYPVYDSPVVVVPALLRQRSTTPASDGGYPSGHTNAFFLSAFTYAYAIPERFQELIAAAYDLADTRIVAGMHSTVDVISGRILATGLAAAILADPANSAVKKAALEQAHAYFAAKVGPDVVGAAHSGTPASDPYADREANRRLVERCATYSLPSGRRGAPMVIPAGAEALLETRQPYLTAAQRREVLRTTAFDSGHPLLDGPELWGRLNLFAAADGPGRFDADTVVTMDASAGGFSAADSWRNDIAGRGALVKRGSGSLTLTGDNSFSGGLTVTEGTLVAGSTDALGCGSVTVAGGTLSAPAATAVRGDLTISGGTLAVAASRGAAVRVDGTVTIGAGSTLSVSGSAGQVIVALAARRIRGRFARVAAPAGLRADAISAGPVVLVRLRRA